MMKEGRFNLGGTAWSHDRCAGGAAEESGHGKRQGTVERLVEVSRIVKGGS